MLLFNPNADLIRNRHLINKLQNLVQICSLIFMSFYYNIFVLQIGLVTYGLIMGSLDKQTIKSSTSLMFDFCELILIIFVL